MELGRINVANWQNWLLTRLPALFSSLYATFYPEVIET